MPEVSIIIPNYNHALYLKQRINSVLNQTFKDFELIILDDFSSDSSREVIEEYRNNPKITQVIYNEINSGTTFKQWEKGIGLAKGRYIWIAESDDWCEPTLLEILVGALNDNPACVLAYGQSYCVDDNLNIKWVSYHHKMSEYINGRLYIRDFLTRKNELFNASMAVFKKEAYIKLTKDFTGFKFCGDIIFWAELAYQGDVFVSGLYLNFFRKHDKDVSGKAYESGNFLIEKLKVLSLFKDKSYITHDDFKILLVEKYKSFITSKFVFKQSVVSQINALFFSSGDLRWKLLLYKKGFLTRLKHYNKRLMNKMSF